MHRRLKVLSFIVVMALMVGMLPPVAMAETVYAGDAPTTDGARIYANGTPVVLKEVGGVVDMYRAADTAFVSPVYSNVGSMVIYGGWESGDHTGDTSVTILSGAFSKSVYGGSRNGTITGNTNLDIQGGTFSNNVFGGSALAGADITGSANVTAASATFNNCTVFGAGLQANSVGNTNVAIKSGSYAWVYGGGDIGSVTNTAKLTIESGTFGKTVFGGSDSGTVGNTDMTIHNGTFNYLYGGGWAGAITGDTKVTIEGGSFEGCIYGGGGENTADVGGNADMTIDSGTFYLIHGGGYAGDVTGDTNVTINGGIFLCDVNVAGGTVWGGGYSGSVGNTNVTINATDDVTVGGTYKNNLNVYGSGEYGSANTTNVKINGGNIDKVFGAGTQASSVTANTSITVGGTGKANVVHGGGMVGGVTGNAKIVMKDQAHIYTNVYGGCSNQILNTENGDSPANVGGNVSITLQDTAVVGGCIYGNGYAGTVGSVDINLKGGTVNGENSSGKPVCGGGLEYYSFVGGAVTGAAIINVYPETTIAGGKQNVSLNGLGSGATVGTGSKINYYYHVNYDANTGTGTLPDAGYILPGVDTAAGAGSLSKVNYTFTGWNTQANGTGTSYSAGKILNLTQNETLYAQWIAQTVTGVTVSPSTASVQQGDTQSFSAAVTGQYGPAQTVTWSVSGNNSGNTKISSSGVLTVGSDETTASITVKATSTVDTSRSGTATVTVNKTKYLTGISMQTLPTRINYVEGQSLGIAGAALSLKYSDNSSDVIAVQPSMVSGFDSSKTGSQKVTVTYQGKSTSFDVNVIPAVISNKAKSATVDLSDADLPSGVTSVTVGGGVIADNGSNSAAYDDVDTLLMQDNSGFSIGSVNLMRIALLDQNGNPIKDFGKVTVSLPIPAGMSGNLHVYWYDPENHTLKDMKATQKDGYLVFETTHFSYYAIAELNVKNAESETKTANPKTGDGHERALWPLLTLPAAFGMVLVVKRKHFLFKRKV